MIVLDEHLCNDELEQSIGQWYPGKVACITEFRPLTRVLDAAAPMLLLRAKTFVTINYRDFWNVTQPHRGYSIISIFIDSRKWREVDPILRGILNTPGFKTKNDRMGKVISWRNGVIEFYGR